MLILISISFSFNITSALTGGLCIIKLEEFPLNLNDRSFISWNYVVCTYKFFFISILSIVSIGWPFPIEKVMDESTKFSKQFK